MRLRLSGVEEDEEGKGREGGSEGVSKEEMEVKDGIWAGQVDRLE